MEITKKHSKTRKAVSVFLSFTLLFSSIGFAFDSLQTKATNAFSGEEYFNAIYFKKGDLSTKIYVGDLEELAKDQYTQNERADINELQNIVSSTIKKEDPSFMANFKKGIESNDLKTIETTVNNGGKVLLNAFLKLDQNLLKNNQVFQKYLTEAKNGLSVERNSGLVLFMGIVIYGPIMGYVLDPMSQIIYIVVLKNSSYIEKQTSLYKEQFIYNIYELQK